MNRMYWTEPPPEKPQYSPCCGIPLEDCDEFVGGWYCPNCCKSFTEQEMWAAE